MSTDQLPPPHRPLLVRLINAIGRLLASLGLALPRLDEEKLLAAARKKTGLDDFGPDHFREGMRVLIDSITREAKLNQLGRIMAQQQILDLLCTRLRLIDHWKRHPEVLEEKVERPLFVLGLPRTGTTILYGLIAQDPAHRSPLSWEVAHPMPPPETATYESDPRIAATERDFDQVKSLAPTFQAIHPMGAKLPQECISITACEFESVQFELLFDIPTYQEWYKQRSMRESYRFHRKFLQHLQSRCPGERWVLKSPAHLNTVESLLAEYPDAMIVQTHRDPLAVTPSVSSLEYSMRGIATDHNDPHVIGEQQTRLWSGFLDRCVATRDGHPEHADQFVDIQFTDILADPIACVRKVYDHFGLELTSEAESRMRAFQEEHRHEKHGKHHYTLEMFGLDTEGVSRHYANYCERFGVARTAR